MKMQWVGGLIMAGWMGLCGLPVVAADIVPFEASYKLTVKTPSANSPFSGGRGNLNRLLERTCDGWINAEQMRLTIDTRVGGQLLQEVRFSSWEALDGLAYRFNSRVTTPAGDEFGEGRATLSALGESGEARLSKPEEKTLALPAGTLFPASQVRSLIESARNGEKLVNMFSYDGTEVGGAEPVSGLVLTPLEPDPDAGHALLRRPGWRYSLAIYAPTGPQATPNFSFTLDLLDNGIPKRVELDFDSFILIQEIDQVEAVESGAC